MTETGHLTIRPDGQNTKHKYLFINSDWGQIKLSSYHCQHRTVYYDTLALDTDHDFCYAVCIKLSVHACVCCRLGNFALLEISWSYSVCVRACIFMLCAVDISVLDPENLYFLTISVAMDFAIVGFHLVWCIRIVRMIYEWTIYTCDIIVRIVCVYHNQICAG